MLTGAVIKCANLTGVNFTGAELTGTDFTDAIIDGARFDHAEKGRLTFSPEQTEAVIFC